VKLSSKYRAFIRHRAKVEFLEGTTYAGKTTVGAVKFMLRIAESDKQLHVLAGLDLGTIEKNIINKDLGILETFAGYVDYYPSGRGKHSLPHILYRTPKGEKIIYVVGYDNKMRWKKVLGGQYGCIMIDEINVADMDFVREIAMRCDYLLGTLNPDDPNMPVYPEYIDRSRPLDEYWNDVPQPIMQALLKQVAVDGWTYWFFSFRDNASLTEEKMQQIMQNVPPGTKQYKNKIEGLRGRHTGLVFSAFTNANIVTRAWLATRMAPSYTASDRVTFKYFTAGVDTSYSRKSDDTIAFTFAGITTDGRLIKLATQTFNNTERAARGLVSFSPSDVAVLLHTFLDKWTSVYERPKGVFIDSADQATLTECLKHKRQHGGIYDYVASYKKFKIIDRCELENGWFAAGVALIVEEDNRDHIAELNVWSWEDDGKAPEDKNDHTINSSQYNWMPFKFDIKGGGRLGLN